MTRLEITALYQQQHLYHSRCHPIFSTPLQTLLSKPSTQQNDWLLHNHTFLRTNLVTPSPTSASPSSNPAIPTLSSRPSPMSPKILSQNYARNTNIQHSEDTIPNPIPIDTPIRLTSERVLSPREVTDSANYA